MQRMRVRYAPGGSGSREFLPSVQGSLLEPRSLTLQGLRFNGEGISLSDKFLGLALLDPGPALVSFLVMVFFGQPQLLFRLGNKSRRLLPEIGFLFPQGRRFCFQP